MKIIALALTLSLGGSAASLTLNSDGASSLTLTTFADGFPLAPQGGPRGVVFTDSGGVLVSHWDGTVRKLKTSDGQHADSIAPASNNGAARVGGLVKSAGKIYMANPYFGALMQIDDDGVKSSVWITAVPGLSALAAASTGIRILGTNGTDSVYEMDSVAKTQAVLREKQSPSVAVSLDGKNFYLSFDGQITGYRYPEGTQSLITPSIPNVVALGVGGGTLVNFVFVLTTDGKLYRINTQTTATSGVLNSQPVLIATGGTKGECMTTAPDGSVLICQADSILRLSATGGSSSFSISPTSNSVSQNAGTAAVNITASSSTAAWTATSNAPWLTFPGGSGGTGNGVLIYAWGANSSSANRTGTLTVAGNTFTVQQSGNPNAGTFSLTPTSATYSAVGGTGTIAVKANPSTAAWSATPLAAWITILSGNGGVGDGSVAYAVGPNGTTGSRSGEIVIGGQSFSVIQAGGQSSTPPPLVPSRAWNYTWSDTGQLTSVQGPRTDVNDVTSFTYDANGVLSAIINALGQVTSITDRTAGGLPLTVVDVNGVASKLTYDARQRLMSRTTNTASGALTTAYSYDPAGNLVTVTQPDGASVTRSYDKANRLTAVADLLGQSANFTLDAMGNRTQTSVLDAGGSVRRTHSASYDLLGRLVQDVGAAKQTALFSYDSQGKLLRFVDPLQHATQRLYDDLDRLAQSTDAGGGTTQSIYEINGHTTGVVDANGALTGYSYDGYGNMIQRISPDSGEVVYFYDAQGNLLYRSDETGGVVKYTYDALNRLVSRTYPFNPIENVKLTYDEPGHGFGVGRLTTITDAMGTLSRSYDERGNVINEQRQNANGGVRLGTSYSYDAAGRLASISYPSGWTAAYARDSMGRTTAISAIPPGGGAPLPVVSKVSYLPFGPVNGLTYGNGITSARTFDQDYRLTGMVDGKVQNLTYAYDAANNVKSIVDGINPANNQTFGYDAMDRLTSANGAYGKLAYTYDSVGNRLTETAGAVTTNYTYASKSNRLYSTTVGAGTARKISYTADGNVSSTDSTAYGYNQTGRLASVTTGATKTAQYTYDGFGQRVLKVGATTGTTQFIYDLGGRLVEQDDETGSPLADYVYLGGVPVATIAPATGNIYFLHTDRLGAPQVATGADQKVVWAAQYQPFGKVTNSPGTIVQDLRLPGQEADADTGLHHNGFREYVPEWGRYLQSDPIGLAGGLNTYGYVRQNPAKRTDPWGLDDTLGGGWDQVFTDFAWIHEMSDWVDQVDQIRPPLAFGVSLEVSNIAPIFKNGGGVWGINLEYTGDAGWQWYRITPDKAGSLGLAPGASLQANLAIGHGSWAGPFQEIVGSYKYYGGSFFWSPDGTGDWLGVAFGGSWSPGKMKGGAGVTTVDYTQLSGKDTSCAPLSK